MSSNLTDHESSTNIESKTLPSINHSFTNHQQQQQFQNQNQKNDNNINNDNSFNKPQVSNLTKTLLSSTTTPSASVPTTTTATTTTSDNSNDNVANHSTTDYISGIHYDDKNNNQKSNTTPKYNGSFPQNIPNSNNSFNYIPSSHNTPTVVGTSYTSNHSYNASLPSTNNFISQPIPSNSSFHNDNNNNNNNQHNINPPSSVSSSFKPNSLTQHALPTTNVYTDTVTSSSSSSLQNRNNFPSITKFTPSSLNQGQQPQQQTSSFSIPNTYQPPMVYHPTQFGSSASSLQHTQQQRIPSSLPTNPLFSQQSSVLDQNQNQPHQQQQQQQPQYVNRLQQILSHDKQSSNSLPSLGTIPISQDKNNFSQQSSQFQNQNQQFSEQNKQNQNKSQPYIRPEPDHYLTYNEFLQQLNKKDQLENGTNFEEHLNIVDFPVNDLIIMLSCLLTKIIEANDKLHPNHFENTIAIRQKIKEEKKIKKLQRKNKQKEINQGFIIDQDKIEDDSQTAKNENSMDEDINNEKQNYRVDEDEIDEDHEENDANHEDNNNEEEEDEGDEEDDEMKNKYLANVLAFHGTNVPGISLQAYLARVLKYCPVTNEVFLSLLVYFDRIAKKANNLNQKRKNQNYNNNHQQNSNSEENQSNSSIEAEQLFVMDSYNIHRLIISGITVSSKFFSDIFYKNLRYAKVGGLPLEELNYLELQFLLLLDFKLMISVEDLQNYGDLLSRFWKREQQQQQQQQQSQSQQQQQGQSTQFNPQQTNQTPTGNSGNGEEQNIHQTTGEVQG
ncbi:PCL7 [Candida pseudojiufengensis]|uniref:PCL7 n=1 Tax=Candida pseudojiufengensis TaxID=497109 RepID=UPI002224FFB2|nr:PCL7 [Candida pseudojiufengensis]KAI5964855.1 PCL7 [Candida pseudojiufengensis]